MKVPDNAARIWIADDKIYLNLPGPASTITPHQIELPNEPVSWQKIRTTLEHRAPESLIGSKGDPYQSQVEQSMKTLTDEYIRNGGQVTRKRTFTTEEIATAMTIIRECGGF